MIHWNQIASDNDFVSKIPLPQFKKEVRYAIEGVTKVISGVSTNNLQSVNYGANVDQGGNATNDGMIIYLFTDPGGIDGVTSAIQTQLDNKSSKAFAIAQAVALG